jgi:hypothetical protein
MPAAVTYAQPAGASRSLTDCAGTVACTARALGWLASSEIGARSSALSNGSGWSIAGAIATAELETSSV